MKRGETGKEEKRRKWSGRYGGERRKGERDVRKRRDENGIGRYGEEEMKMEVEGWEEKK